MLFVASFFFTCARSTKPQCTRPVTLSHVIFETETGAFVMANVLTGSLLFQMVFANASDRSPFLATAGLVCSHITLIAWAGPSVFYNVFHSGAFALSLLCFGFTIQGTMRKAIFLLLVIFLALSAWAAWPVAGVVIEVCLGVMFATDPHFTSSALG